METKPADAAGTAAVKDEPAQGQGPMSPEQISSLMASATKSMVAARQDILAVGDAVSDMAKILVDTTVKLAHALDGQMVSMEGKVRSFCEMAIESGRQAEAARAVLEKTRS